MAKKTLDELAHQPNLHQPPAWLYWILMWVVKILNARLKTHFTIKKDPSKEAGSIVYIANHASRADYLFTAPVCYPKRLNFVVGYNEFFRFPINFLLRFMQVIPKKNFTPDVYAIRNMMSIIKQGGNICIMPEGMSSITGMAQPIIPGGAKLVKKLGVPVYYSKISGGYLTYTKHCLDERVGRVDVVVDRMFTAEELRELSVSEIEDRMNRLLAHDDYIWNKKEQVRFNGKGEMAKNLDTLLYMCPRCQKMYQMETSKNRMKCKFCGNEIEIDERYNISPIGDSICPELVTDWTIMERERAAADVRVPGFRFSEHVKVGVLPVYKSLTGDRTSIVIGDGILQLDATGLTFKGTLTETEETVEKDTAQTAGGTQASGAEQRAGATQAGGAAQEAGATQAGGAAQRAGATQAGGAAQRAGAAQAAGGTRTAGAEQAGGAAQRAGATQAGGAAQEARKKPVPGKHDFSFHMSTAEVPTFGMCTDISRFYTFVDGRFIEFYPDNNDVLRWDHLTEEMHRAQGNLWQNTKYRHTED